MFFLALKVAVQFLDLVSSIQFASTSIWILSLVEIEIY